MTLRLNNMAEYEAIIARMHNKDAPATSCDAAKENKFHAVITEAAGIKFRSKKEARYYLELVCRQKAGELKYFLRQVPFDLPGKHKHFVDFMIVKADNAIEYVEVKGRDLPMGKLKRKQVEDLYNISIAIV